MLRSHLVWLIRATIELRGEWAEPRLGKIRFDEYAPAEWLATKADVGPQTPANVQGRLPRHIFPLSEHWGWRPPVPRTYGARWPGGGVGTGVLHGQGHLREASQDFAQAVTDGLLSRSPCAGIRLPEGRRREEMHFLAAEEVATLADAVAARFRALVYAAAYTGMRAGEPPLCAWPAPTCWRGQSRSRSR